MPKFFDNISETTMRWYDSLSDRERRLVAMLIIAISILLIFSIIFGATSSLSNKRAELMRNKESFQQIKALESEYLEAKRKNERVMMNIRNNDVSLFTFIQGITSRLGLSVKDLSEQKRPLPKSNIVDVSVRVNLSKLSIDKVTALIEAIETSEYEDLIKVTRLKINKRFGEPELLDLQMTVSTWKSS